VQFFEFVRLELERELKGEIHASDAAVDEEVIHTIKERVSAEFEKTKKSFEDEMESLKELFKVRKTRAQHSPFC